MKTNALGARVSKSSPWHEEWRHFERFAAAFLIDALKGALILGVLAGFSRLFVWMRILGVDEETVVLFDKLHFWLSIATYVVLGLDFLYQLAASALARGKHA